MSTENSNPEVASTSSEPPLYEAMHQAKSNSATGILWQILKPLASLQLTVVLFAMSMVLVFFGTLVQTQKGIWEVISLYFWSWFVFLDMQQLVEFGQIFFRVPKSVDASSWYKIPFPAGKLVGLLMFLNLLAAHIVRFKFSWQRFGIILLHSGILLLFVGEYITREFQVEQQMRIAEGDYSNYAYDIRNYELAFTTDAGDGEDRVTVIPKNVVMQAFRDKERIKHPDLPVDIEVLEYFENSGINDTSPSDKSNPASAGIGKQIRAIERPTVSGVDQSQNVDLPSVYIRLYDKETGDALDTYLVSLFFEAPQKVKVGDNEYGMAYRFTRYYKPYRLELIEFRFDRFIGTEVAKNYSSQLRLVDEEWGEDREVIIRMNEPLRYRGEAFFQSSFTPDEKSTILQVVDNPGWLIPYLSCVIVTVGLLIQFSRTLNKFILKRLASGAGKSKMDEVLTHPIDETANSNGNPVPPRHTSEAYIIPAVALAITLAYLGYYAMPTTYPGDYDLDTLAKLPVVKDGRVKPLDTVARVDMRSITKGEEFKHKDKTLPAIRWFIDTASASANDPGVAGEYEIFRIENNELLDVLGLKNRKGLRYSVNEMRDKFEQFDKAAKSALDRPVDKRSVYDKYVLEVRKHLEIYLKVWQGYEPLLLPPLGDDDTDWRSWAEAREASTRKSVDRIRARMAKEGIAELEPEKFSPEQMELFEKIVMEERSTGLKNDDPAAYLWSEILTAYRTKNPERFNQLVQEFTEQYASKVSNWDRSKAHFEYYLNKFAPYFHCYVLYVLAALLTLFGWLALSFNNSLAEGFRRASFYVLLLTFLLHTFSLLSRMLLMERPLVFVTNLYSSAVFIGWVAVGTSLILEMIFRYGIANSVAAIIGIGTSALAHQLALQGDTLEMMQAVLDTNFWLATHVTTITIGYSATFMAGAIGMYYILAGAFSSLLKRPVGHASATGKPATLEQTLGHMMYGIICAAVLLSFVGTVLGGIWADQSWGRFWGWDPKENGAVLIVIWNALILHARWGGMIKNRGMAICAVLGCMVTAWSWFGTNQLSVGLHAYGFNEKLATGCAIFWIFCLGIVGVGMIPKQFWLSNQPDPATDTAKGGLPHAKPKGSRQDQRRSRRK